MASDSSDEEIEESEEIKNAYIPYLYAKKNIIKVIKDMKRMRSNHIHIVADIQKEYKGIEDETQVWFCLSLIFHEQYLSTSRESPALASNAMQINAYLFRETSWGEHLVVVYVPLLEILLLLLIHVFFLNFFALF